MVIIITSMDVSRKTTTAAAVAIAATTAAVAIAATTAAVAIAATSAAVAIAAATEVAEVTPIVTYHLKHGKNGSKIERLYGLEIYYCINSKSNDAASI